MDVGEIEDVFIWEQFGFLLIFKLVVGGLVIIVFIIFVICFMLCCFINFDELNDVDEFDVDEGLDLGDDIISMLMFDFDEGQVGFVLDGLFMLFDLYKDEDVFKVVCVFVVNEFELLV